MKLCELEVLIVDCQSTGASPAHGSVLELGWALAGPGQALRGVEAHWITLPAGHSVSAQVRKLTGYDEAAAALAITPEDAWARLRSASGRDGAPTAIHFARFELAFLRDWSQRFEPERVFPFDAVCVHAIACRLFPDLPRRSLRALAGYLGHGVTQARQSLAHVEATAFIWQKLVSELANNGVVTWAELAAWLRAAPSSRPRSKRRSYPLPKATYRALPDGPGVYRMLRSNGDVLYVGKATSLKKRVATHFSSSFARHERALEMLTQVHDLRVTSTASALEAALLENEEIKALAPPYNVQLVVLDARTWFASSTLDSLAHRPDAQHRLGPLPSTHSVRALGALRSLLRGAAPESLLRARAAGASERWAPDEAVFAEGFAAFSARHALQVAPEAVPRALAHAARRLLATKSEASNDGEDGAAAPELWDPERVLRHLERAVAHGYQLLQRARWLCLLHDSVVVFREPGSGVKRVIFVNDGQLGEGRELRAGESLSGPQRLPALLERQASFDRAKYDRLRTLSSELKRVLRDGGEFAVALRRARWLSGAALAALLRWI